MVLLITVFHVGKHVKEIVILRIVLMHLAMSVKRMIQRIVGMKMVPVPLFVPRLYVKTVMEILNLLKLNAMLPLIRLQKRILIWVHPQDHVISLEENVLSLSSRFKRGV